MDSTFEVVNPREAIVSGGNNPNFPKLDEIANIGASFSGCFYRFVPKFREGGSDVMVTHKRLVGVTPRGESENSIV